MFNGDFGEGNQGQALPLTRLPLFFGNPEKDVLTAELWIARVESATRGADWNNVQTMGSFLHFDYAFSFCSSVIYNFLPL